MIFALMLLICSLNSLRIKQSGDDCFRSTLYLSAESPITSLMVNGQEKLNDKELKDPTAIRENKLELQYLDEISIAVTDPKGESKVGVAAAILTEGNVLKLTEFDIICGNKIPQSKVYDKLDTNLLGSKYVWDSSATKVSVCKIVFDPYPRKDQAFSFIVDDYHDTFKLNGISVKFTGDNNWGATRIARIPFIEGDSFEIVGLNANQAQQPSSFYNNIGKDLMSIHAIMNYKDRNGCLKSITTDEKWTCGDKPAVVLSPTLSIFNNDSNSISVFKGAAKGIWAVDNPVKTSCFYKTPKPKLMKFDFYSDASIVAIRINGNFIKTRTLHSQEREHIVPTDPLYAYVDDIIEIEALNDHIVRFPAIYGGLATWINSEKTYYTTNSQWRCNDGPAIEFTEKSAEFCTTCFHGSHAQWIWDSKNTQRVKCLFKIPNN